MTQSGRGLLGADERHASNTKAKEATEFGKAKGYPLFFLDRT
jgi:hypothetical protein